MIKYLAIGPGAMGYFIFVGVLSKLKQEGRLEALEEISGASAGGLAAFLFCATKGEPSRVLDFSLNVPVKQIMKPNIKNLLLNYGLVPHTKIRKVLSGACTQFLSKIDVTFKELYEWYPVKLHLSSYCVDVGRTVYFSVDTTPTMSVLDAVCATVAKPFLFTPLKLGDGWNYIDGGSAETIPGAPFLGKGDGVMGIKLAMGRQVPPKDLKTYGLSILYSTMKLRYDYTDFPILNVNSDDQDFFDFGASNDGKLKLFILGHSQKIS
jgi:predicted acylesterase/phospholipase RssA